jgi:putative redox protein
MTEQSDEVTVTLTNDKVQFNGVSRANPGRDIAFDYHPPIGDGQGYNGLELLLMSLAGCSGTAVLFLLRKMRKNISGIKVNAKGIRKSLPPLKFEKIFLEFIVNSQDAKDTDVQKVITLAEESICPVWQMIKNNVEVMTEYKIIA